VGKHTKKRDKRHNLNDGLFEELPTVNQIVDKLLQMTIQTEDNRKQELRKPGDEFIFMGGKFLLMQFLKPKKKGLVDNVTEDWAQRYEQKVIAKLSNTHTIVDSTATNASEMYNFRCYRAVRKGMEPLERCKGGDHNLFKKSTRFTI
jgi:hypothetical protein